MSGVVLELLLDVVEVLVLSLCCVEECNELELVLLLLLRVVVVVVGSTAEDERESGDEVIDGEGVEDEEDEPPLRIR